MKLDKTTLVILALVAIVFFVPMPAIARVAVAVAALVISIGYLRKIRKADK